MKRIFVFALLFLSGSILAGTAQTAKQLKVASIQSSHRLPLTEALRTVGMHLRGGFVSFGVDLPEVEPEVDANMPDTILGDAVQRLTSQIPGYSAEFVSDHVVEVYAKSSADPSDPLNLPVRRFSVKSVPAAQILSAPSQYIPELKDYLSVDSERHDEHLGKACGRFTSTMGSYAVGVSLFLTGRTVRQILDAVAEADAR